MRREIDLGRRLREVAIGIRKKLGLVKSLTKSSVLDAQLVDEGTTFLPAPVCFIG